MPRPKNMSAVLRTQKRWIRLQKHVRQIHTELAKPMSNTIRKSSVVIAGRIINMVVCEFVISDTITNTVLHELNAMLMRISKQEDIVVILRREIELLHMISQDIHEKITSISKEVEASRVFT